MVLRTWVLASRDLVLKATASLHLRQHIGKWYMSHRRLAKAHAGQSLCYSQICSGDLEEVSGKTRMSVAQIGDCACAFEEPQMGKQ